MLYFTTASQRWHAIPVTTPQLPIKFYDEPLPRSPSPRARRRRTRRTRRACPENWAALLLVRVPFGRVAVAQVDKSGAPHPRLRARILSRLALNFHALLYIYIAICDFWWRILKWSSSYGACSPPLFACPVMIKCKNFYRSSVFI